MVAARSGEGRGRLALSVGCRCGVGPEVSVAAAASERAARVLLVGDGGAIRAAARGRGVDGARLVAVGAPEDAWALGRGAIPIRQPTGAPAARARKAGAPPPRSGGAPRARSEP